MIKLIHSNALGKTAQPQDADSLDLALLVCELDGRESVIAMGGTIEMMRKKMSTYSMYFHNNKKAEAGKLRVINVTPMSQAVRELSGFFDQAKKDSAIAKILIDYVKNVDSKKGSLPE
jgi:hypothetical protein